MLFQGDRKNAVAARIYEAMCLEALQATSHGKNGENLRGTQTTTGVFEDGTTSQLEFHVWFYTNPCHPKFSATYANVALNCCVPGHFYIYIVVKDGLLAFLWQPLSITIRSSYG